MSVSQSITCVKYHHCSLRVQLRLWTVDAAVGLTLMGRLLCSTMESSTIGPFCEPVLHSDRVRRSSGSIEMGAEAILADYQRCP
jgi:hypothetical protein